MARASDGEAACSVHIHSRVTSDRVMSSIVDAHNPLSEVLHLVLEAEYIRVVLDQVYDHLISCLVRRLCADIATQAARIVPEAIGLRIRWGVFHCRLEWT